MSGLFNYRAPLFMRSAVGVRCEMSFAGRILIGRWGNRTRRTVRQRASKEERNRDNVAECRR